MNRQKKDLNLIYIISFMDLFAIGLTFPLLSNHLRELGASHFTIGLISSIYSGLQIVSGPIAGSWSDVRDRKSVLLITLALCSIVYPALGLTHSIFFIIITRVILGCVKHTQSLCKAIISDLLPLKDRAGAFGKSAAYGSIGFIAGPILGGHMSEYNNGFSYVCYFTGLLFLINIALVYNLSDGITPATKAKNEEEAVFKGIKEEFSKSVKDLLEINWAKFWDSFLLRFLFGFAVTMFFSQQSLYLKEQFNLTQRQVGYTISYYSAIGTTSAFLLNYINDFFYRDDENCLKRLKHFFVLLTACSVGLYIAPNITLFLLVLIPFSISSSLLRIVSMELMLKQAYTDHRGSLSGASNSIMSLARFITPVSTGLISDICGSHNTMLFSAIPPFIGVLVTFKMKASSSVKNEKVKTK